MTSQVLCSLQCEPKQRHYAAPSRTLQQPGGWALRGEASLFPREAWAVFSAFLPLVTAARERAMTVLCRSTLLPREMHVSRRQRTTEVPQTQKEITFLANAKCIPLLRLPSNRNRFPLRREKKGHVCCLSGFQDLWNVTRGIISIARCCGAEEDSPLNTTDNISIRSLSVLAKL